MEKIGSNALLTGGRDTKIRIFNPRTAEQITENTDHTGWVFTIIGVHGNGVRGEKRIASSGYDETIHIFDMPQCSDSNEEEEEGESEGKDTFRFESTMSLEGHANAVRCLASFPRDILVSGSDDLTIKCWNIKKGKCVKTIKKMHRDSVKDIKSCGRNYFVSGSDDRTVLKWSLKRLRKPVRSLSLKNFVSKLLYYKEKDLIFVGMSNVVGILDKNLHIQSKFVHDRPVTSLCHDVEHNVLITGDRKGYIAMWDLRKASTPAYFGNAHSDYVTGIAVLNEEEYITASLQRPSSLKYWKFSQNSSSSRCSKSIDIDCDGVWSMLYMGQKLKKDLSEQMKIDVEERVTWLLEESDEEDDILVTDKMKIQFYDRHMFVSKVFLCC